jgi:hypothetical protein
MGSFYYWAHPIRMDMISHNYAASAKNNNVSRKRGADCLPYHSKLATLTEMSISGRLRITFTALMEEFVCINPREDHDRDQVSPCSARIPRSLHRTKSSEVTHHDFQAFPWPSFGS